MIDGEAVAQAAATASTADPWPSKVRLLHVVVYDSFAFSATGMHSEYSASLLTLCVDHSIAEIAASR